MRAVAGHRCGGTNPPPRRAPFFRPHDLPRTALDRRPHRCPLHRRRSRDRRVSLAQREGGERFLPRGSQARQVVPVLPQLRQHDRPRSGHHDFELGLPARRGRRLARAHHAVPDALLLVHQRLVPPRAPDDDGGSVRGPLRDKLPRDPLRDSEHSRRHRLDRRRQRRRAQDSPAHHGQGRVGLHRHRAPDGPRLPGVRAAAEAPPGGAVGARAGDALRGTQGLLRPRRAEALRLLPHAGDVLPDVVAARGGVHHAGRPAGLGDGRCAPSCARDHHFHHPDSVRPRADRRVARAAHQGARIHVPRVRRRECERIHLVFHRRAPLCAVHRHRRFAGQHDDLRLGQE